MKHASQNEMTYLTILLGKRKEKAEDSRQGSQDITAILPHQLPTINYNSEDSV